MLQDALRASGVTDAQNGGPGMPDKETIEKAKRDKREGKSPST